MTVTIKDLAGAIDIQVHTGPDVRARVQDDFELAQSCAEAGFAGAVLKGHRDPTGARALLASKQTPGVRIYGSVVLNRNVGGINPFAVEALVAIGGGAGRKVWLPTLDADFHVRRKGGNADGIAVAYPDGKFHDGLDDVLEVIAKGDLVLGSGHVSPDETVSIFKRARERGCRRLVATHVTSTLTRFSDEQMRDVLRSDGYLEMCAWSILKFEKDAASADEATERMLHVINTFGTERVILSSDLGKAGYPAPVEGLAEVATRLHVRGVSESHIEALCISNPRNVLE